MTIQSKEDYEQKKLASELFGLLEENSFQPFRLASPSLQEIREKIRKIKDINKWAINMEALEYSERCGVPNFDYAVKYAMDHPEIKRTIGRLGYKGNISPLDFVFQPIRWGGARRTTMEEVMDVILDFHPNMAVHVKLLVDHGARTNMSLYNFWSNLEDNNDIYDDPEGLHLYHDIKENLKKGLGRTVKTLQRTIRRKKKAKKKGDDVRLKLATSDNRHTTKYMKDNMESSVWNKIKKGLEEDGISEEYITSFKEQEFDPKWERRSEDEIDEWFQESLYHLELKKEIWRKMEQTLTKKGLTKENIKVFKNKFKEQWKLLNQFKKRHYQTVGPDAPELWDELIEKDIQKWFQGELDKMSPQRKTGLKKKKKKGSGKKKKNTAKKKK